MAAKFPNNDDMDLDTTTSSGTSTTVSSSEKDFNAPENERRKSSYDLAMEAEQLKYLNELQKEIADWAALTAERKKALRMAKREAEKPMVLTYEDVKDHLTPEERAFLEARPDYKGLRKRAEAAKIAIDIAYEEKRETMVCVYHFVDKLEKKMEKDVKKLIDMKDPILDS